MRETLLINGKWQIPGLGDEPVTGTLSLTPGKNAILELKNPFPEEIAKKRQVYLFREIAKQNFYPIITGKGNNSSQITLVESGFIKSGIYSGLRKGFLYTSDIVIDGEIFLKKEDISFDSVSVNFEHVNRWFNYSEDLIKENNLKSDKYKSGSLTYNIKNQFEIAIKLNHEITGIKNLTLNENPDIKINYPSLKELSEIIKDLTVIQNFFSFFISFPVYATDIYAIREKNPLLSEYVGKKIKSGSKIYLLNSRIMGFNNSKTISEIPYLTPFMDISENFEEKLNLWFDFSKKYSALIDLYFESTFYSKGIPENIFLALCQSLELYHRVSGKFKNYVINPEEYKNRMNSVKKALQKQNVFPKKVRESIMSTLKFGNRLNFENRIFDILNYHSGYMSEYIKDFENFSKNVSSARNFIVHRDIHMINNPPDKEMIAELIILLDIILHICILSELKFSPAEIHGIGNKFFYYKISTYN